jgi:hypothetical protein
MTDATAQKALWDVRKAGLNIMMSMKGDGKPVSFIEDCAVPLEHLADYVERLTAGLPKHGTRGTWYAHASVGTLHVRPILDMRRDGAAKMRAIAEEASAMVREYKGAYSGEHGDGLVRSEWVAWQFGPRLHARSRRSRHCSTRGPHEPGQDRRRRAWTTHAVPVSTRHRRCPWPQRSTGPRGTCRTIRSRTRDRAGHRRRSRARLRQGGRDVQQQRSLPQVRRGHHVPELSRHARREHLTRGRANTLRLALSGHSAMLRRLPKCARRWTLCVSCKGASANVRPASTWRA